MINFDIYGHSLGGNIMMDILCSLKANDWISVISCLIAIASAIFTFCQARVSKKTYKLQMKIYTESLAHLNLEIFNNFIYDDKQNSYIYFFFGVNISNLSDKPTSIKKYTLSLLCDNLIYKPDLSNTSLEIYSDLTRLNIAQNINPHNSVSGWCVFELLRENYQKINVNTYLLTIEDIHGQQAKKESILLREELVNYEIKKV